MQPAENGSAGASKVLASAANGVVEMIERYHGDIDTIFGRAGLNTQDITSPYQELALGHYCGLFEEAARQTANSNFGLRFGNAFKPKRLGAIGYIAVNSPTMASALSNLVGYFPAHQDNSVLSLERDHDLLSLNYQIVDPRITEREQDAELSLGMFCNLFKHCLGEQWAPLEIHFEHRGSEGASEHEQCFAAPVRFGQCTNSIIFRRRHLDAIMPDADPYLFAVIEPTLAERRSMRENPESFVDSIREHIRHRLGDETLSLAGIARSLDMSIGALQRRLKAHDVSFQALVCASRQELALHYVRNSDMRLTEVALALGYSEQSAFTRAFRRWTGMSPQRYRKTASRELIG